jgi:membrane protease YdiL (CAAX protease family)
MNTYLKYQPPAIHFLAFLALAAGFFLVDVALSSLFFADLGSVFNNKDATVSPTMLNKFRWAQVSGSIISFILPSLLFAYYSSPKPLPYVGIKKNISILLIIAAVVLLFVVQPFITWLGEINSRANFGSLQKSFKEVEALYNRALKIFLQMKGLGDLFTNLFIMALLPAIGEELFFRGGFQKTLLRLSGRPWLAILVSSSVFAVLHGTFFKVLPIFTLGLLLGTVYFITRNLWYPIVIHFVNNAFAVLSVYYADSNTFFKKLADDNLSVPGYAVFASFICSMGLIYFIKRRSDQVLPATTTNEDNDYLV